MIIDLSVSINDSTPIYPGDPAAIIKPAGKLEKDGFTDHFISIGTHVGTHIDAPMHMIENGKSLDKISIEHFVGQGRFIEITNGDFDIIKNVNIQAGDIVLLQTGMSEKYYDPFYFTKYPVMSDEIAKLLVEKKIKIVGIDACSVDNQDGFPNHKVLLSGDVLIIENLTNLDRLKNKSFKVYALPIKLQVDGAPARVIAEIE